MTLTPYQQGGLTSMTLHDLFTLPILPIGTSGTNKIQYMKYINEYILNLQIHQHHKFSSLNFQELYVKMTFNEQTMTISTLF